MVGELMTPMHKWILASASPRRRELLSGLGLKFTITPSSVVEPERAEGESPTDYVLRVARLKVLGVGGRRKRGVIVGADTVVVVRNTVMGKPSDMEEGRNMLRSLSGRWHEVVSGVCLLDCRSGRFRAAANRSRVHFRRLDADEIQCYLETGEYSDKAGAYAIQGYASMFIDRIEGCYFNVVGLPIVTFRELCTQLGIDLFREIGITKGRRLGIRSQKTEVRWEGGTGNL
jgi:septum formation protein